MYTVKNLRGILKVSRHKATKYNPKDKLNLNLITSPSSHLVTSGLLSSIQSSSLCNKVWVPKGWTR